MSSWGFKSNYYVLMIQFLAITSMLTVLPSCHPNDSTNQNSQLNSQNVDEDSSVLLIDSSDDAIPNLPRRRLIKEIQWHKTDTILAGVHTQFNGIVFEAQTKVAFEKHYSLELWVFAPGDDQALVDEGDVFLNNSEKRPFKYICRYLGYLETDMIAKGQLTIFGSGLESNRGLKDLTGVVQSSPLFDAKVGDTWVNIFNHCREYGEKNHYKESIDHDLIAMTRHMVYHNPANECMTDSHCENWFSDLSPRVKEVTRPRCVAKQSGIRYCALRGISGSPCSVIDRKTGKRLTSGLFEYPCDKDYKCMITQKGWWIFKPWKAECRVR